jgi:site-specific DNA recombinase
MTTVRSRIRAIEAARMSKLAGTRDQAIGLARRSDEVARYAGAYDYDLVGVAEDTDVSGSTDPFGRKGLGAWLKRPGDFDVILATDLDRVGRNARHLTHLREWCEDTGHKLIILSPHLEWPPPDGDMASGIMWDLLGRLAQYELEAITKRNQETRQWLTRNGALAGKAPYGYRVAGERGRKTLEINPVTGPIVREAATRYLAGSTLEEIANDFNRRGLASRNKPTAKHPEPRWHPRAVGKVLRGMTICGRLQQGDHVLRYEGIITVAEHRAIVARMDERAHRRGISSGNRAMLTSVLFCGYCRAPLYRINANGYFYYYDRNKECPRTPRLTLPVRAMNAKAGTKVIRILGDEPEMRTEVIAGKDYEDEIDQLKLDLAALDPESPVWDERVSAIRAEIASLRSRPVEAPQEVRVPTGRFIADVFADADDETSRGILMRAGIRFYATVGNDGDVSLKLAVDGVEAKEND